MMLDQQMEWRPVHVNRRARPGILRLLSASLVVLLVAACALFIPGDGLFSAIRQVSPKLRYVELDYSLVGGVLVGGGLVLAFLTALYSMRPTIFLVVLISAFCFSELLLPFVSYVSLVLRYSLMVFLVGAGALALPELRRGDRGLQICGLLLLAWMLARSFIGPLTNNGLMLLPINVALYVGILIGLRKFYASADKCEASNRVLVFVGIAVTFVHFSALALSPGASFLAGRFRSYYVLPTNFANTYVLLVVGMMWYAIQQQILWRKLAVWCFVGAGAGLLVLSGTRNAVLVLGVSWVLFFWIAKRKLLYGAAIAAVLVAAIFGNLVSEMRHGAGAVDRLADFSVANRLEVWSLSWHEIKKKPVFGYGLGISGDVLGQRVQEWERATFINAHNAYLGIWLQLGGIGLLLVLALYATALRFGVQSQVSDRFSRQIKITMMLPFAIVISLAVAGMFEENLSSRGTLQQVLWGVSLVMLSNVKSFRTVQR